MLGQDLHFTLVRKGWGGRWLVYLGSTTRRHHIWACAATSDYASLLGFLLLYNLLVLLKELFKVGCDAHHATVKSVDAGCDCLFVSLSVPFLVLAHLRCSVWYVLLVILNLCESIFDLDVELGDLVLFWGEKRIVFLHWNRLKNDGQAKGMLFDTFTKSKTYICSALAVYAWLPLFWGLFLPV